MNIFSLFKYVPLSVLRVMARFVAWAMALMPNLKVNHTINTNLQLACPQLSDSQRQQMAHNILRNQALSSVESVKAWAMPPEWSIAQIKQVHNQHILQKGLQNPKGMLAIVPHLGTWEMMNAWLNQFGKPTIMYKPIKGKQANDFVLQGRQRLHATLVPTDGTGVKAIFKTLKQGGFSIILPDHVPDLSGGVIVPFFGVPTLTSTLAPKLASKTHCAMVGLSCIRRPDGDGFDIHCYDLNHKDIYSRDITTATQALNLAMQHMITPFMPHYVWGYRRFKHVPFAVNPYKLSTMEMQKAQQDLLQTPSEPPPKMTQTDSEKVTMVDKQIDQKIDE